MKIAGIIRESIVNGPGIRFVVFGQGCPHKCHGCHNPQTHDFEGGFVIDSAEIMTEIEKNPLLSGVTFSGGEPFCQAGEFADLAAEIKSRDLNIMTYTGYTFEEIHEISKTDIDYMRLLVFTDILVDGPYVESKKDLTLKFRGSLNQRIIDVHESNKNHTIVEFGSE
ncbi:anaerobic ribonucleoside-triphosphate reductase activating protein [Proteocatella sphenisci]|uniref:anaerobic ribonucleoside-triphosphate reductase activating protein n=1 Tax=Proteocatella sphenisci TaxID=181070 RepID=UPI0004AEA762|nr:anaerobic ribonucleoside-triphosphate reductase activating protein [Proteocatella sphenisci]